MSNITLDRPPATAPVTIPITQIDPSPYNPRDHYDQEKLESLANDIRLRGVLQPIIVRPIEERYEILAGERRFRACMLANEDEIPAIVRECGDMAALEICVAENFQRADLNPIEAAKAMQMLAAKGLSQAQIGERVGRLQGEVSKAIGLLKLPYQVQQDIAAGTLSATHGHYLCALIDNSIMLAALAADAVALNWTTDQLKGAIDVKRKMIDDARQPRMDVTPAAPPVPDPVRKSTTDDAVKPNLVDTFMGDAPIPTDGGTAPPSDQVAPYRQIGPSSDAPGNVPEKSTPADASTTSEVKWTKPDTAAAPAIVPPAPVATTAPAKPAPVAESVPASSMVQALIPQAIDDWLWDQEWTAVTALELLRRLQDALIASDCEPSIETLIAAVENGTFSWIGNANV